MIWGCICYDGVGTFTAVEGNINSAKCIDILENNLWPVMRKFGFIKRVDKGRITTVKDLACERRRISGGRFSPPKTALSRLPSSCFQEVTTRTTSCSFRNHLTTAPTSGQTEEITSLFIKQRFQFLNAHKTTIVLLD